MVTGHIEEDSLSENDLYRLYGEVGGGVRGVAKEEKKADGRQAIEATTTTATTVRNRFAVGTSVQPKKQVLSRYAVLWRCVVLFIRLCFW